MKYFIQKIYFYICKIYSYLLAKIDELFYRENIKECPHLKRNGYVKIKDKLSLDICKKLVQLVDHKKNKTFYANKYQRRIIFQENVLKEFIYLLFNKKFCNFLTFQTGFKYSIDFFCLSENFFIPEIDRVQNWYGNNYHLDKPNSRNTLKLFLPLSIIEIQDGSLELLNIKNTKKYFSTSKSIKNFEKYYFEGDLGDLFLSKLNLCLHRAGIPLKKRVRKLITIQLNPSKKWYLNSKLYKRQYLPEPKFTAISNQFVHRIPLLFENQ